MSNYLVGGGAALGAAIAWATAQVIFGHNKQVSPFLLNFINCSVATAFLLALATLAALGGQPSPNMSVTTLLLLGVSGILTYGLGDTAYFVSLQNLGTRDASLLNLLVPPCSLLLSFVFLSEGISEKDVWGIVVLAIGIFTVINADGGGSERKDLVRGLVWGCAYVALYAGGSVLADWLLKNESSFLWSAITRLGAASLSSSFLLGLEPRWKQQVIRLYKEGVVLPICIAAVVGTAIAILALHASFKQIPTAISLMLFSTSPIVVGIILAFLHKSFSKQAFWGTLIAVGGVCIVLIPT